MRNRYFVLVALSLVAPVKAAVYLTPFVGYTVGGEVEDSQGNAYDVKPSASFALAAEIPYQTGRFGLLYATQQTDIDNINHSAALPAISKQFVLPDRRGILELSGLRGWRIVCRCRLGRE